MIPHVALAIAALLTQAEVVSPQARALQLLDGDTQTEMEALKGLDAAQRRAVAHALVAEFRRPGPNGDFQDRNAKIEQALAALGPDAAAEIPALVTAFLHALGDEGGDDNPLSDFYGGFDALVAMGAPAVPALIDLLGSRNHLVRVTAAGALGKLGKVARPARPKLLALATNPGGDFQRFLGPLHEVGLDGLDPRELDAVAAAGVKAKDREIISALPERCGPLLARELDEPPTDRGDRIVLLQLIAELKPSDRRTIDRMARYLDDSDDEVVDTAIGVLAGLGDAAKPAAPAIAARGLAAKRRFGAAARALAKLDPERASQYLAQGMSRCQAPDCASIAVLAPSLNVDLGPLAEPFGAALADGRCPLYLVANLGLSGPKGIEALVRLLGGPQPATQLAAMGGLGAAHENAASAVPDIVAAGRRMIAAGVPGASRATHDALVQISTPESQQAAKEFPR